MATETERKFLVNRDLLEVDPKMGIRISQGYPAENDTHILRVRREANRDSEKLFITVKSKDTINIPGKENWVSREEIEFEVPAYAFHGMLAGCSRIVVKTRYKIEYDGLIWDVDFIQLPRRTPDILVLAEIEIPSIGIDPEIALPPWIGEEVTGDPQYYNTNLTIDSK